MRLLSAETKVAPSGPQRAAKTHHRFHIHRGFLTESEICRLLDEQGVPYVRGWEGSEFDIYIFAELKYWKPGAWKASEWASFNVEKLRKKQVQLLGLEIKTRSIDSLYQGEEEHQHPAAYLVSLSYVPELLAIVPDYVWRDIVLWHLIGNIMQQDGLAPYLHRTRCSALAIFQMPSEDLHRHLFSMVQARATRTAYRNESTGLTITPERWPRLHSEAATTIYDNRPMPVLPHHQQGVGGCIEFVDWFTRTLGVSVNARPCPLSPYLCDFLLTINGVAIELRVEMKTGQLRKSDVMHSGDPSDTRSPTFPGRQYHLLLWQPVPGQARFGCLCRHDVLDNAEGSQIRFPTMYEGSADAARMMAYIVKNIQKTMTLNAEKLRDVYVDNPSRVAINPDEGEDELEDARADRQSYYEDEHTLNDSEQDRDGYESGSDYHWDGDEHDYDEFADGNDHGATGAMSRTIINPELTAPMSIGLSIPAQIQLACMMETCLRKGDDKDTDPSLVIHTLPPGHSYGTHLGIRCILTEKQKETFRTAGVMPNDWAQMPDKDCAMIEYLDMRPTGLVKFGSSFDCESLADLEKFPVHAWRRARSAQPRLFLLHVEGERYSTFDNHVFLLVPSSQTNHDKHLVDVGWSGTQRTTPDYSIEKMPPVAPVSAENRRKLAKVYTEKSAFFNETFSLADCPPLSFHDVVRSLAAKLADIPTTQVQEVTQHTWDDKLAIRRP